MPHDEETDIRGQGASFMARNHNRRRDSRQDATCTYSATPAMRFRVCVLTSVVVLALGELCCQPAPDNYREISETGDGPLAHREKGRRQLASVQDGFNESRVMAILGRPAIQTLHGPGYSVFTYPRYGVSVWFDNRGKVYHREIIPLPEQISTTNPCPSRKLNLGEDGAK